MHRVRVVLGSTDGGTTTVSASSAADCTASCNACCDDHCSTQCVSVPTTADCTTKCNADCTGSCTAQANASCQEQCQESSFTTCKNELANDCTTQCQQSVGAIFCNGSYVAASDVDQCVSALNAVLTVKIAATASGSCSGNECNGTATVKTTNVSCAATPARPARSLWAFGTAIVALIAATRRRARAGD